VNRSGSGSKICKNRFHPRHPCARPAIFSNYEFQITKWWCGLFLCVVFIFAEKFIFFQILLCVRNDTVSVLLLVAKFLHLPGSFYFESRSPPSTLLARPARIKIWRPVWACFYHHRLKLMLQADENVKVQNPNNQ